MKPLTAHWADQTAARVVGFWGEKDQYVVASGITPSGVVHIGNFREAISVDLVARALRDLGKKVRFIYSWDSFDTFRKVPKNLPNQEMLQKNLRRPISRVPDPRGQHASYAEANMKAFEAELDQVGICPEYIYQHQRYSSGFYAEPIKEALDATPAIRKILDEYRADELDDEWLPIAIYCDSCEKDQISQLRFDGKWSYSYRCDGCGHQASVDIRKAKNLKLNWRTDWPMRWNFEKVDFEPGGKDHSSDGGSYDTGKKIVELVWKRKPPVYLQYDFVSIKGGSGKMSSSSGELITLNEALAVYDPQMVRWIFASQRPNHDFSLAFDSDVLKIYDEFDRSEKTALCPPEPDSSKWQLVRRNYELSTVSGKVPAKQPYRPAFRELCNRLQICNGDQERTKERFYTKDLVDPVDVERFHQRATCAWTWLSQYADEQFRYRLMDEPHPMELNDRQRHALSLLRKIVEEVDLDTIDSKDLNQLIYQRAVHAVPIEPKELFTIAYQKLIGRDQGPRLPGFMKEIGKEKLLELL